MSEPADLVVEGEILVLGPIAPRPGDTLSIPITKYRVLRVLAGRYDHPQILVGHMPEDRLSESMTVGARQRLELTRRFPEYASLLNPFVAETAELGVYFCRSHTVLSNLRR